MTPLALSSWVAVFVFVLTIADHFLGVAAVGYVPMALLVLFVLLEVRRAPMAEIIAACALGMGGLAAAAAVGVGIVALQGGDGESTQPTATAAVTAPATPGTTQTPATPGTTQPPTTGPTQVSAGSIQVLDRWDYAFTITANTCPFGASVGDRYAVSFRFEPATGSSAVINDGDRVRVAKHGEKGADHAVSYYRVVEQAARALSWLEMEPYTGRTHQLRVHAAHIGCPIIGDPKYFEADTNWEFPGGIQNRLHLHARRIVIPHPDGGTIDVTAPLPPHMRQSWNLLGFDEASAEPEE